MHFCRVATLSDVEEMALVHVTSWQETYMGLLDDDVINKFTVENRKKLWSSLLQDKVDSERAYVAIHSNKVVGMASWTESLEDIELVTLYVLSEFQRQGIGRDLFQQVKKDADEKGKRLVLWVLDGNSSFIFYEKMGMRLDKREAKKLGDTQVQELMYTMPFQKKDER